jgi:hypothetical protein
MLGRVGESFGGSCVCYLSAAASPFAVRIWRGTIESPGPGATVADSHRLATESAIRQSWRNNVPEAGALQHAHTSNLQLAILACGNGICCCGDKCANTKGPLVKGDHGFSCAETCDTAGTRMPPQTEQSMSMRNSNADNAQQQCCLMTCHSHKLLLQHSRTLIMLPRDDCPSDVLSTQCCHQWLCPRCCCNAHLSGSHSYRLHVSTQSHSLNAELNATWSGIPSAAATRTWGTLGACRSPHTSITCRTDSTHSHQL